MISAAKQLPVQQPQKSARWDWRKYGTLVDPVHKSHMSKLIGEYACTEAFKRDRIAEFVGEQRDRVSGKTEMGTAGHATIHRALTHPEVRAGLLTGKVAFTPGSMRSVLTQEFDRAVAGKEVAWYKGATREDCLEDVAAMLDGLFRDFHRHVAEVVLSEAGWIAPVGKHWTEGHIDLVYRPRTAPNAYGITDWKTGAQRPHPIELDHGFEAGLYSNALQNGLFLPEDTLVMWRELSVSEPQLVPLPMFDTEAIARAQTQREAMHIALRSIARTFTDEGKVPSEVVRFGVFPEQIWLTHLADYVPYSKKGDKTVERAEDLEHWSRLLERQVMAGEKIKYVAGQQRGPAWYRIRRTAEDVKRLEKRLSTIVGWVRLGLFVDAVSEKCTRCSYKDSCLNSGYEARGDEAKAMNAALRGLDLEGEDLSL